MTDHIEDLRGRYAEAAAGGPGAARLAGELGSRLFVRYFRDGGTEADRDEAIDLLDEALTVPQDEATLLHVARGTLLFFRAMPLRPGGDPTGEQAMAVASALMSGELNTPERIKDRDRTLAHMRWVVAHEPPDAPVRHAAEVMIAGLRIIGASGLMEMMAALSDVGPAIGTLGEGPRQLVELLEAYTADAPPERLIPAFDAVLRQLPAGHRLRSVILAEAGAVVALRGSAAGLPGVLAGLPSVLRDALDDLPEGGPLRDQTVRTLAGLLMSATAQTGEPGDVARLVKLAGKLVAESGDGRDRFLRAMALTLRGRLAGDAADLRAAAEDLRAALTTLPPEHSMRPVAAGMLGVLLNDRYLLRGVRADADAGEAFLADARAGLPEADGDERTVIEFAGLMSRTMIAIQHHDRADLDAVIVLLEIGLARLDDTYPWRSRLDAALGLAYLTRGAIDGRPADVHSGAALLQKADADLAVEASGRPAMRAAGALADLLIGFLESDQDAIERAARRLDEVAAADVVPAPDRAALDLLGAQVALARFDTHGRPEDLRDAIERFERVRSGSLTERPGHPLAAHLHTQLALAYRAGDRHTDAVDSGLSALHAFGDDVLLQTGTAHALDAARHSAGLARQIAEWAVDDDRPERAIEAVELGRGIVLHSAMVGATVPDLLRASGHPDLAAEWDATPAEPVRYGQAGAVEQVIGGAAVPSDLRSRVLAALPAMSLSAAPSVDEIAGAVRDSDADAIVYLLAADGDRPGRLLTVSAAGDPGTRVAPRLRLDATPVLDYVAAHPGELGVAGDGRRSRPPIWRHALGGVCDWAWPAVIEPLLESVGDARRVILVPVGGLGQIPWHAARTGDRYACAEFTFSYAASARQLRAVSGRPPVMGSRVTLVADPTGDLVWAGSEVEALRGGPYPDAVVLGRVPRADGPGTLEEVLRTFAGAPSVLHLACHAVTGATPDRSHVTLDGPAELPVSRILADASRRPPDAPGGLVVLSACGTDLTISSYDEALTLATAFLAAGAVSVVGSLWPVIDEVTPCLMAMFHHYRTACGLGVRDALRAAQLWMLDPDRKVPPAVAQVYPRRPGRLTDPAYWAAFTHHGR